MPREVEVASLVVAGAAENGNVSESLGFRGPLPASALKVPMAFGAPGVRTGFGSGSRPMEPDRRAGLERHCDVLADEGLVLGSMTMAVNHASP